MMRNIQRNIQRKIQKKMRKSLLQTLTLGLLLVLFVCGSDMSYGRKKPEVIEPAEPQEIGRASCRGRV